MPERKVWSEEEDDILRYLRQQRKEKKWASIARIMQSQFGIHQRTGKQCRQRYHNHLDAGIKTQEWSLEEEQLLFKLHEEIGNKWSVISHRIPGRSDNCVKNHFYSKLRKAMRKLNKIIQDYFSEEYPPIKQCTLPKIIDITESKFRTNSKEDEEIVEICQSIKNRLFKLNPDEIDTMDPDQQDQCKNLIEDISSLQKSNKKSHKGCKKNQVESQYKIYLKPPKPFGIKRYNSNGSISSEVSDDASSMFSSTSFISSCSDLSEYDNLERKKLSSTNNSLKSIKQMQDIVKIQQQQEQKISPVQRAQSPVQFEKNHDFLIEQESDNYYQREELKFQNCEYNNIYYEDTPVMTRIFAANIQAQPDSVLFKRKDSDSEEIVYKEENLQQ